MDDLKNRAYKSLNGVTDGPWSLCAHLHSDKIDEGCSCGYRGVIFGPEHHGMAICQPGHDPAPIGEEGTEPQRYDRATERQNARFIVASRDLVPEMLTRIEQLEAVVKELQADQKYRYIGKDGKPVLARDLEDSIEQLEAALTRANAATAAAYEVAAREVECGCGAGPCQDTANCAAKDAAAIRALATPDQTAALGRIIAEAEVRTVERIAELVSGWRNTTPMTGEECATAILYVSKKGGA